MPDFSKYDLNHPIDISIPLRASVENVEAWYVNPPVIEPVRNGDWIGEVSKGGTVNFRNVFFNPHGHGTHTECVGHIAPEIYSVNQHLKTFFFDAILITVEPENNTVITLNQLKAAIEKSPEAIVIRTLPNEKSKLNRHYSNTNPPYLAEDAAKAIADSGIKHLLIDLPSVDPEVDGGKLVAHRAFWNFPANTRFDATITELIFVDSSVKDGLYLLNLMIAPFENDASPSKPILYPLK